MISNTCKRMPKWEVHNKWAKKLGVPGKVSNFVNLIVDFPEKSREFMEFLNMEEVRLRPYSKGFKGRRKVIAALPVEHDGRGKRTTMHLQLKFLRQKGSEYVKAWYLHHILDYIKSAPILSIEEILKRIENKTESCQELEEVKSFVKSNSEEILQECRKYSRREKQ